jgi:hypothetical protein
MDLVLESFDKATLIPSSAVFSRENKTFVYLVEGDVVKRVPVRVQYEDGIQAKVAIIVSPGQGDMGDEEVLQDLTISEKVIRIAQGEIRDGQKVNAKLVQW